MGLTNFRVDFELPEVLKQLRELIGSPIHRFAFQLELKETGPEKSESPCGFELGTFLLRSHHTLRPRDHCLSNNTVHA